MDDFDESGLAAAVIPPARAGQVLGSIVVRLLATLRVITFLLMIVYLVAWWSWYESRPAAILLAAVAAAWGVLYPLWSIRRGLGRRLTLATVALTGSNAMVMRVCLPPESIGDLGSWVLLAVLHAAVVAAWVLPLRQLAVAQLFLVGCVAAGGHEGRPQIFTAVVVTAAIPGLFAFGARRLRAMARRADDRLSTVRHRYRAQALVLALARDRRERDRVLHDTVLNTLTGIAWGGGGDVALARRRCAASVSAVRGLLDDVDPRPASGLTGALESVVDDARDRGLVVHLSGVSVVSVTAPADPPDSVVAALVGAAGEALSNVERHAGTGVAWVDLDRSEATITLRVRDEGAGFAPRRISPDRLGVRESVLARMDDVGGTAAIDAAPGRGTTVTLTWRLPTHQTSTHQTSTHQTSTHQTRQSAGPAPTPVDGLGADRGTRAVTVTADELRHAYATGLRGALAAVALAWQGLMLLPLLVTLGTVRSVTFAIGVWVALTTIMLATARAVQRAPLGRAQAAVLTAVALATIVGGSLNVSDADLLRIMNWPLVTLPLLLAFATVSRPFTELLTIVITVAGTLAAVVVLRDGLDPLNLSRLISLCYGLCSMQLIVAMLGPVLGGTADTTARAVRAEAELAAGQDSVAMIRRARVRWVRAIEHDVLPMLDACACGRADPRNSAYRLRCARQATSIRRMLLQGGTASSLADVAAELDVAVVAGERRGLAVEVQSAGDGRNVPADIRADLAALIDRALSLLPGGRALLTVLITPAGGSAVVCAPWSDPAPPVLVAPSGRPASGQAHGAARWTDRPAHTTTRWGALDVALDLDEGRLTIELIWSVSPVVAGARGMAPNRTRPGSGPPRQ